MTKEQMQAKKDYRKAWYLANRERVAGYNKAYYEANQEKLLEKQRAYSEANREKILESKKAYREANQEEILAAHRRRTYDLTPEEYQQMLDAQGGVCYICHQEETKVRNGKVTALAVDHNHTTGAIRKLLCCACNFLLGKVETRSGFAESMTDQTKAQMYLDYLRSQEVG